MLDKFLLYIHEKKLIKKNESILLAVSGGIDSMVMLDLFLKSNYKIGVGHINHHLRFEESDEDAAFVNNHCKKYKLPYFQLDLDPDDLNKGNIHDLSRNMRYDWLSALAKEHNYDKIATAHHKDDATETFFINLMRGSGLNGLDGIDLINGNIIRPLLFLEKQDIITYAKDNKLLYREDSSNKTDKYLRNKIRHNILPEIYKMDQRAQGGIQRSIQHLSQSKQLLDFFIQTWSNENIRVDKKHVLIPLSPIIDSKLGASFLFQVIKGYGYSSSQCEEILLNTSISGRLFLSKQYESIIENSTLVIRLKTAKLLVEPVFIQILPCKSVFGHFNLEMDIIKRETQISFSKHELLLDADKISLPLTVRHRQDGDFFKPLGMKGKTQKIKDYLTNRKVPNFEKDNIIIVEDTKSIICILMEAISESVKITENTKRVLRIKRTHLD